jgi:nitroreductase
VEKDIAALLKLRAGLRPVAMLPIGWPAEQPPRMPRRALTDLAREHEPA